MGRFHVYAKPYADDFGAAYEADFRDITSDVISIGDLKFNLDNNEFDIGIFRHSAFTIELANNKGLYSDVGTPATIFKYSRNNTIIRLLWSFNDRPRALGFHPAGVFRCSPRQVIADFLLTDDACSGKAGLQTIQFQCLAMTTLLDKTIVPFGSIANGNLMSLVIFTMLNQAPITNYLTVSAPNITCGQDNTIDNRLLGDLENKTVTESLKKLLLFSNTVLYVRDNIIYAKPRTAAAELKFKFFKGRGSDSGSENIIDITNFKNGVNRIKNYVLVAETSIFAQSVSSIAKYGIRKKEIEFLPISNNAKQQAAANAIRDEFGEPQQEVDIETPLNYRQLDLILLDRVSVDYPNRVIQTQGAAGIYGVSEYGVGIYGDAFVEQVEIDPAAEWKILGYTISPKTETMTFTLRRIG